MTNTNKQHDCCIRGREVIKVTSTKTFTVTRSGEWGRKHVIVVEEQTLTKITSKRTEYTDSQKCIKEYERIIRQIKSEYKNVLT